MVSDPEVFGGFLLIRRIAESSMAGVYLAVRLGDASGRSLVLKRPPLGERASGRAAQAILREAEVLAAVRGAGIPALEATGDIAGLPYVALEHLRGVSLARLLALGEPLPFAATRAVGRDIARALAKLHAAGWVHRDVAPSNIFIDDVGEAYLIDFGLCARAGGERESIVAGTRGYAAPEAATPGAARTEQDVYGLAVCLVEAALGRRLFDEASLVEAAGRGDAPREVAALEAELPGIGAALRRDPAARPAAADFERALTQRGHGPDDDAVGASSIAESRDSLVSVAERARSLPEEAPVAVRPGGLRAASAAILTPTVPMSVPTVIDLPDVGVLATLRDLPDARGLGVVSIAPGPPPAATASTLRSPSPESPASIRVRKARSSLLTVVATVFVALAIGFLSGRFSTRVRGGSLSIAGPLPKRTEVSLDSKKLTFAEGVPMPVPVGSHTLTITSPKSGKREVAFTVRPGEQVVFLPQPRVGAAQLDDDATP